MDASVLDDHQVTQKGKGDPVLSDQDLLSRILIAADSPETLRKVDVLRVLESTPAAQRPALARYIVSRRDDLAKEVGEVMADELGLTDWQISGKDYRPPMLVDGVWDRPVEKATAGLGRLDEDHPAPIPRQLLQSLVGEQRGRWISLHRVQHELKHFQMQKLQRQIDRLSQSTRQQLEGYEAFGKDAANSGAMGDAERAKAMQAAADKAFSAYQTALAKLQKKQAEYGVLYDRQKAIEDLKNAVLPGSGDLAVDLASGMRKTLLAQQEETKRYYRMYLAYHDKTRGQGMATVERQTQQETVPAWHVTLPEQGAEILYRDGKPEPYQQVPQRLAAEAESLLTAEQRMSGMAFHAYVLPAGAGRHGAVRLVPTEQAVPEPWKLLVNEPLRIGMLTREQLVARLIDPLRREPVLGEPQPVAVIDNNKITDSNNITLSVISGTATERRPPATPDQQLDLFGEFGGDGSRSVSPPMITAARVWHRPETLAMVRALERGDLGAALSVLKLLKAGDLQAVLLDGGFTLGSEKLRAKIMESVQGQLLEAARRQVDGFGLRRDAAADVEMSAARGDDVDLGETVNGYYVDAQDLVNLYTALDQGKDPVTDKPVRSMGHWNELSSELQQLRDSVSNAREYIEGQGAKVSTIEGLDAALSAPVVTPKIPNPLAAARPVLLKLENDEAVRALGLATIVSVGEENVYLEKFGTSYYFKTGNSERFQVGQHDFSREIIWGDVPTPEPEQAQVSLAEQADMNVFYTVSSLQRDSVDFTSADEAAKAFVAIDGGERPSVTRTTGRAAQVIASTTMVQEGSVTQYGKWASDSDVEFKSAFDRESRPVSNVERPVVAREFSAKVMDAGDELYYNKRNRYERVRWEQIEKLNPTLRVAEVAKEKIWPRPDYQAMVTSGVLPFVAHLVKQMYDGLPTKPVAGSGIPTDGDLKRYVDVVNRIRDAMTDWMQSKEEVQALVSGLASSARSFGSGPISVLDMIKSDDKLEAAKAAIANRVWPLGEGVASRQRFTSSHAYSAESRLLGRTAVNGLFPDFQMAKKALKEVESGWPAAKESWQRQKYAVTEVKSVALEHAPNGRAYLRLALSEGRDLTLLDGSSEQLLAQKAAFEKTPWLLLNKSRTLLSSHETQEAAVEAARATVKGKSKPQITALEGQQLGRLAERSGEDYRAGRDVSAQDLIDTFGFRGVNFGSWVPQGERQEHLNRAFDSFMDLAQIIGIPPRGISLGGMVGVAFGAQGSGSALAHFVAGVNEINITRTKGAGSLAHEFAHALDHNFAAQGSEWLVRSVDPWLTAHAGLPNKVDRFVLEEGKHVNKQFDRFGAIRPEVVAAFDGIVKTMEKTSVVVSAEEMAARKAASLQDSGQRLDKWIAFFQKEYFRQADAAQLSQFEALAQKLRDPAAFEHNERVGSHYFSEGAMAIRALVKTVTGRVPNIDNLNGLEWAARRVTSLAEAGQETGETTESKTTDYKRASLGADQGKAKPYWATKHELFARAFETFVYEKAMERGISNPYLVKPDYTHEVYPLGEDRTRINAAFDTLVGELRHREEQGHVFLYSRGGVGFGGLSAVEVKTLLMCDKDVGALAYPLLMSGKLVIHENGDGVPGWEPGIKGMTTEDGTVHLFASGLVEETVKGTLLHEVFHGGVAPLIGDTSWQALQEKLQTLFEESSRGMHGPALRKVAAHVEIGLAVGDSPKHAAQEFGAYLIEHADKLQAEGGAKAWVNALVGRVQAWVLERTGLQIGRVTGAELRALSVSAMRSAERAMAGQAVDGEYTGRVGEVDLIRGIVVQMTGREQSVKHRFERLDRVPAVGEMLSVKYREGRAGVSSPHERESGAGRG